MDIFDAIKLRSSVREFTDKPIPKDLIEKIVDCGRLAPTARKEEPWEFVAVTDKKTLAAMADITDHGKFIKGAACAIVTFCKNTKYYLEDGCAAVENMLIAASGLGIGACWVAGDKKPYASNVTVLLSVPAEYKLINIIALGYPQHKVEPQEKRPIKDVLHWEKF